MAGALRAVRGRLSPRLGTKRVKGREAARIEVKPGSPAIFPSAAPILRSGGHTVKRGKIPARPQVVCGETRPLRSSIRTARLPSGDVEAVDLVPAAGSIPGRRLSRQPRRCGRRRANLSLPNPSGVTTFVHASAMLLVVEHCAQGARSLLSFHRG